MSVVFIYVVFWFTLDGSLHIRIRAAADCFLSSAPVILDPNTASPQLILSDDLTSLTFNKSRQPFPDNAERFDFFRCVLGSEGFKSGTHSWDVEVGNNSAWTVGIISILPKKRRQFLQSWCLVRAVHRERVCVTVSWATRHSLSCQREAPAYESSAGLVQWNGVILWPCN